MDLEVTDEQILIKKSCNGQSNGSVLHRKLGLDATTVR